MNVKLLRRVDRFYSAPLAMDPNDIEGACFGGQAFESRSLWRQLRACSARTRMVLMAICADYPLEKRSSWWSSIQREADSPACFSWYGLTAFVKGRSQSAVATACQSLLDESLKELENVGHSNAC